MKLMRWKELQKRFKVYLMVSVAVSVLCGVVATILYLQYYFRYPSYRSIEELVENTNFNPWLWVMIPISFVVGFFVPSIAFLLKKVEDAVDRVKDKLGPLGDL